MAYELDPMTKAELRQLARDHELPDTGSRSQLLERLDRAGVDSLDDGAGEGAGEEGDRQHRAEDEREPTRP